MRDSRAHFLGSVLNRLGNLPARTSAPAYRSRVAYIQDSQACIWVVDLMDPAIFRPAIQSMCRCLGIVGIGKPEGQVVRMRDSRAHFLGSALKGLGNLPARTSSPAYRSRVAYIQDS